MGLGGRVSVDSGPVDAVALRFGTAAPRFPLPSSKASPVDSSCPIQGREDRTPVEGMSG